MEAERAFEILLLAATAVLLLLLFLPFVPVILAAILLAYLLQWPYEWLARRIGERLAALGVIAVTLLGLLIPFFLIVNVVLVGIDDILKTLGTDGLADAEGMGPLLDGIFGTDFEGASSVLDLLQEGQILDLANSALDVFGSVSEAFIHLTILLFVWYYLLTDGDRFLAWIKDISPLPADLQADLYDRADELLYVVVIGNFVVAVADGVLVAIGLWVVGFSDVVFWLFVSVFLALIPLVGTMLVWIPAASYLVLIGEPVLGGFLFLYGFVVVGAVDNLLRPFLGAPEVGLEPGLFVVGVLTGLTLFGVMGIFFGPMLLVMGKVVFETVGRELH